MAFFAKRVKKGPAQRVTRDASDSENDDHGTQPVISVMKKKVCVDEDEDMETFQVKKSKLSRKMDREKEEWGRDAQASKGQAAKVSLHAGQTFGKRGSGGAKKKASWKDDETPDASKLLEISQVGDIVSITEDMMQEEQPKNENSDEEELPTAAEPWEHQAEQAKKARAQKRRLTEIAHELGEEVVPTEVIPKAGERYNANSSLVPPGTATGDVEQMKDAKFSIVMPAEEDDEWETTQMRLALGATGRRKTLDHAQKMTKTAAGTSTQESSRKAQPNTAARPLVASSTKLMNPTEALARLKRASSQLAGGFEDRKERMTDMEDRSKEASSAIERLKAEEKALEESHKMLLDTEDLVFCLAGLLEEKRGRLDKAMETLAQMEKDLAAQSLRQRRREIHGDVLMAGAQLTTALSDSEPENDQNKMSKQRLRKRRSKLQKQRESFSRITDRGGGQDKSQREGWATSESEDERKELAADRAAFCNAAWKQIFADVDEDFLELERVLPPFEKMKKELAKEYAKSHVSLSLPELASMYVGYSLLWWDPLRLSSRKSESSLQKWGPKAPEFEATLEKFSWFDNLAEFSELAGESDPDADLVPSVVRRCIFPEVKRRLSHCWDVSSRAQTEAVVAMLDECLLFESEDASASSFAEVLTAAHQRLEEGIAALVPQALLGDDRWWPSHARMRLLWRACKIAENVLLLDERLPDDTIAAVVINSLVAQRMLPAIKAPRVDLGELEVIEHIIGVLPSRWLEKGLPPALAPLREALGPRAPQREGVMKTAHRASKILQQLKCFDEAQALLQQLL